MPGMDGTGPLGYGSRTGRGAGRCAPEATGYGRGLGRGFGRGLGICRLAATDARASLIAQKTFLRERLNAVENQLKEES